MVEEVVVGQGVRWREVDSDGGAGGGGQERQCVVGTLGPVVRLMAPVTPQPPWENKQHVLSRVGHW